MGRPRKIKKEAKEQAPEMKEQVVEVTEEEVIDIVNDEKVEIVPVDEESAEALEIIKDGYVLKQNVIFGRNVMKKGKILSEEFIKEHSEYKKFC